MAPAIPCSYGSVTLLTKTTCSLRKDVQLSKCHVHQKFQKPPASHGKYIWFQPVSLRLLQNYNSYWRSKHTLRLQPIAAVGTDIATEEQNSISSGEFADEPVEVSPTSIVADDDSASTPATPSARSKRTRPTRKSEMPPVKDEDLVPGATFTGKVRSIQPFGAFVDFGAFTDGLVHVSNLSDEFVKDVGTVVSLGQEVKVRLVDVNKETARISLSMRENDDVSKKPQKRETSSNLTTVNNEKPRTARRNTPRSKREGGQKSTKFVNGQVLEGTVKSQRRSGSFISLPEGEEGFLPMVEESEGYGNISGGSKLQVGQKVTVRVLNISRGKLTLTMKKEEDNGVVNKLINKGMVHTTASPFVLAFRQNKEISAFLDEQEKMRKEMLVKEVVETAPDESDALESAPVEPAAESAIIESVSTEELVSATPSTDPAQIEENKPLTDSLPTEFLVATDGSIEAAKDDSNETSLTSVTVAALEAGAVEPITSEDTGSDGSSSTSQIPSVEDVNVTIADLEVENSSEPVQDEENDSAVETQTEKEPTLAVDATAGADKLDEVKSEASASEQTEDQSSHAEVVVQEDTVTSGSNGSFTAEENTESADNVKSVDEPSTVASESSEINPVDSFEKSNSVPEESLTKAVISPALVKKLREETGAGMMDCKNALAKSGGDIAKAQEFLRKKGLASAEKRAGKATAEGRIGSYIHDNRIGVLVEVNCETDFVSRGDIFKELVEDLAMQVAACPQVQYLVPDDVPEEVVNKEREIEMQKEDLQSKPEQFRTRIVDGRINKRLQELALLEQPYIKNDKVVLKDWVKQTIATVGENIKVKRFVRFNLGEGLEKRSENFAAEVAAQTVAKGPPPQIAEEKPAESNQTPEKTPAVAVSAALVKQLREETGAGMMDCKKALAATNGDLEKAQEYLRKKGISSAAKKSSRITAEGRIASYIHDSRIGALIEVNSETDFVARNETFKELVNDLAMQVVACPQVQFVSVEDVPESVIAKEKEIEMQREDIQSKPDNIREKIVDGRISKRLVELALLEQPFIKDDSMLIKDLVQQTVATLGENIKVRRFARFTLGE